MRYITSVILLFVSTAAMAKPIQMATPVITNEDIAKLFLSLFSVVLLIILFSYFFKKINGMSLGGGGLVKVCYALSVGTKEKLMVIEVDGKNLLIGVTAGNISLLKELSDASTTEVSTDKKSFFEILGKQLSKDKK